MVAFTTSDLPTTCNSVEKVALWALMVLNNVALQAKVQEAPGIDQPVAVAQNFTYNDAGTTKHRFVGRISVEISPDWQNGSAKMWTHAQNLSTSAIPTAFRT